MTIATDPLLRRFFPQWTDYKSPAQAWAVRLLLTAPSGGVVLAVLPTGGGKTLTYLLPLLEERRTTGDGSTLVIVPTISLMADQATAINERYLVEGRPLIARAAHSGTDWTERNESELGFVEGEVDVLLVSPERALRPDFLGRIGDMGDRLKFLVIDEVHLMIDWGETFRPDYPRLGWLRERLLRANPRLRTALLSATVTPEAEFQLQARVRAEGDRWRTVRGNLMRYEADINVLPRGQARRESEQWLDENLEHLQTPALIYVTQPQHADHLAAVLRRRGKRAASYTGKTPNDVRDRVLRQWQDGILDYVVGTSAFGLGIDKPNVRSVTHLCIPESLDRLYQEIGRAGRDGEYCQSFVVAAEEDERIAYGNAQRLLTENTATPRWEEMAGLRPEADPEESHLVEMEAGRTYWLVREEHIPTYWKPQWWSKDDLERVDLHTFWNKSLVNFFERCGFVRYEGPFIWSVEGTPNSETASYLRALGIEPAVVTRPEFGGDRWVVRWTQVPAGDAEECRQFLNRIAHRMDAPRPEFGTLLSIRDIKCIDQEPGVREAFWHRVEEERGREMQRSRAAIKRAVEYTRRPPNRCLRAPFAELYGTFLDSCGRCQWCDGRARPASRASHPGPPAAWPATARDLSGAVAGYLDGRGRMLASLDATADPVFLVPRLSATGFRQFFLPEAWARLVAAGAVHPLERFDRDTTLLENEPTAVLVPHGTEPHLAQQVLAYIDGTPGRFTDRAPLLVAVNEAVTWAGKSEWRDRFDGPRVSLAALAPPPDKGRGADESAA